MPFDPLPQQCPTITRGREGLRALATALRMPMPAGFRWNYEKTYQEDTCGTVGCALGLVRNQDTSFITNPIAASRRFEIQEDDAIHIFWALEDNTGVDMSKVHPHHVADVIDRYLDTGEVVWPEECRV